DLFRYDAWLHQLTEHTNETGSEGAAPETIDETLRTREFSHDILGFGQLLDQLRAQYAPVEITRRYAPEQRSQVLAAHRDGGQLRVREVTP
ncbi:MAG: hypothetical protein AAGC55_08525, partial [Myxococcota bacterium]